MFTILSDGVVLVPKAYTIKVDNVLVAEDDKLYFIVPLFRLAGQVVWGRFGQPLCDLSWLKQVEPNRVKLWMVVHGQKTSELVCSLCKHRFNGYTGNCNVIKKHWRDEACELEFIEEPKPPTLMIQGGVRVKPRYFNAKYVKGYQTQDLGDYAFDLATVVHSIAQD